MAKAQTSPKPPNHKWVPYIIGILIITPLIYLVFWNGVLKNKELSKLKIDTSILNNTMQTGIPEKLQTAIDLAEKQPTEDNYINLSIEYYNNKMYKECIRANQKALELNPASSIAYNNICSAYNELKNYKNAEKACKKALKINPSYTLAINNLKVAQDGITMNAKSIAEALATANANPDDTNCINLGNLFYSDFQFQNAIVWYKKALGINPKNATTYNNIGAAYNELGKFAEAKNYCEQAIAIDPSFTLAKNNLKVANDSLKK
jgi:tetratricopeptide (TPR) repeat protein